MEVVYYGYYMYDYITKQLVNHIVFGKLKFTSTNSTNTGFSSECSLYIGLVGCE